MTAPPALAYEWPTLAAAARRICAQRAESDPVHVEKGTLTEYQAMNRLRIARALVAQWDSVVAHQPPYDPETAWAASLGREGAYPHELREDLHAAAARARTIADRHGEDADAEDFAQAVEALAWHERPRQPGVSHVLDVAHVNAMARAAMKAGEPNK